MNPCQPNITTYQISPQQGGVISWIWSSAFGEDFVSQTSTSWETPYKFSGKEKDAETGFDYFGARYCDSDLSVWLSVVPIAIGTLAGKYPSMSAYMYCAGNPVMLVDPDGMRIGDGKLLNKTWNWVRGHGFEEGKYSGTFYGKQRKLDANDVASMNPSEHVTKKEYVRYWEKTNESKMSKMQRKMIDDGCIGIVEASLNKFGHPSASNSYDNLDAAMAVANQARAEGKKVTLFSMEFMTEDPEKYESGHDDYIGDPSDHRVRVASQSVYVDDNNVASYNYTLYDFNSGSWWGANNGANLESQGLPPVQIVNKRTNEVRNSSGFDAHVYTVIIKH